MRATGFGGVEMGWRGVVGWLVVGGGGGWLVVVVVVVRYVLMGV